MASQQGWDDECDVLVVGSGGGALTGAYTAAREGLSVVVAEATDAFGGTTAYSGGGMWFPDNAVLRRAGTQDSVDRSEEHTSELQSRFDLVCRLLLAKKTT